MVIKKTMMIKKAIMIKMMIKRTNDDQDGDK